jgi:predicted lipoprotein with Yx(FWY)xxD motif
MITGNDGMQTTYKGWPLYYYAPAGDGAIEAPGETSGEGVNSVWFVAKPDYTVMIARQALEEGQDPVFYLTDAYGVTLYRFANDEVEMSNCSGSCIDVWPVFPATEELLIPSTIEMADFSTVARTDGESDHWAYQSMPLYYFANDDNSRGSTLGEGVNGVWFVVQP